MLGKGFTFKKFASFNFKFIAICFYFLFWKAVCWLFLKILRKNSKKKNYSEDEVHKKMKFSDFFITVFLKNRIFLPRYSPKESCKKWFNGALWAKSIKLGKKCISVYVITKLNGNHFLLSSMKWSFLSEKEKIISMKFLLLYDLILIHIESLLYLQEKKYIIISNFFLFYRNPALENSFNLMYVPTFYWVLSNAFLVIGNCQNQE